MTNLCLHCNAPLTGKQRKFCSSSHKSTWNNKHKYNYTYTKKSRGRTVEAFIRHLLTYRKRSETLTLQDVLDVYTRQEGRCALSGQPLTWTQGGGKTPTNLSIDRIDSERGYTPDNIQLVCTIVNIMKLHYSTDDLLFWCNQIVQHTTGKK